MNLVFNITRTYEHEFTSNNLIKSNMVIDRISMKGEVAGTCLVLDRVNNMQERRQSPLAVLNEAYIENAHMNVVVPKSRKWRLYLTNKNGLYNKMKWPIKENSTRSENEKDGASSMMQKPEPCCWKAYERGTRLLRSFARSKEVS